MKAIKKILVTGSKGKTLMSTLIEQILKNTLLVNSEFLRIREDNKTKYLKSGKDLLSLYNTIPTWCPFKFLVLRDFYSFDYYIAETDINNAFTQIPGISIGTKKIDIAILTNVFPEHIDGKLINSYKNLIETKLKLIFENLHYQEGHTSYIIINVNSEEIFETLTKILEKKYLDKKFKLFLSIKKTLNINLNKIKKIDKLEKIIFYDNNTFDKENIKEYKLSFNGQYKPAASILSLLYILKKILNLDINLKEITFPKGLGRMDLIEKNGNLFLIDHISEINTFKELMNLIQSNFKGKKINLIFSLKYDALDSKINDFSDYLNKLLEKGIINKLYLFDNLQVRGKTELTTRKGTYKSFELVNKLAKKIKKAEILKDRDEKIKEILSKPHKDELFIISLNSIESDYFKKTFGMLF